MTDINNKIPFYHASLFSGIGGFDLAADWMGWINSFHCEFNPFGQQILKHYWPNAVTYGDIKTTDFKFWRGKIDILSGGFPCQPYSLAGKRKGKDDDRHLWPEMLRAIREIKPRYIVGENVYGLLNWSGGLVFEEVQTDLESEGYQVRAFILPACSVNAPHKRERIWFVAHAHDNGPHGPKDRQSNYKRDDRNATRAQNVEQFTRRCAPSIIAHAKSQQSKRVRPKQRKVSHPKQGKFRGSNRRLRYGLITYTQYKRLQREQQCRIYKGKIKTRPAGTCGPITQLYERINWENFPTEPPVCWGDDGLSQRLDLKTICKVIGRKVNKRFNPFNWWKKEALKAYGNAIVPQVAYEIFKAIEATEKEYKN